jgi:hypothetical protein
MIFINGKNNNYLSTEENNLIFIGSNKISPQSKIQALSSANTNTNTVITFINGTILSIDITINSIGSYNIANESRKTIELPAGSYLMYANILYNTTIPEYFEFADNKSNVRASIIHFEQGSVKVDQYAVFSFETNSSYDIIIRLFPIIKFVNNTDKVLTLYRDTFNGEKLYLNNTNTIILYQILIFISNLVNILFMLMKIKIVILRLNSII